MKSASLISVVFAVSVVLCAQKTKAAATVTAFDGTWSITVKAPEYKNPVDGTVTRAVSATYPGKVKKWGSARMVRNQRCGGLD